VNRFFEWIGLKEKLHQSEHKSPFVSERDLWWASLPLIFGGFSLLVVVIPAAGILRPFRGAEEAVPQ
jgi:hypothetical protein